MRALGVDLGLVRIGIAITDDNGIIASPFAVLKSEGIKQNALNIAKIAKQNNCNIIIFGMPYELDGKKGKMARKVDQLIIEVKKHFKGIIDTVDERFTSVVAEQSLISANTSRSKRKQKIDKVAASLILQSYIDLQDGKLE